MAHRVYGTDKASHRAEIVFTRSLKDRYDIDEVETDYDVLCFDGYPNEYDVLAWVPNGWELVEHHVYSIDSDDEDDDEEDEYFEPYSRPYWDEPEYVYDDELEVV
jgi:hypothetical protein